MRTPFRGTMPTGKLDQRRRFSSLLKGNETFVRPASSRVPRKALAAATVLPVTSDCVAGSTTAAFVVLLAVCCAHEHAKSAKHIMARLKSRIIQPSRGIIQGTFSHTGFLSHFDNI